MYICRTKLWISDQILSQIGISVIDYLTRRVHEVPTQKLSDNKKVNDNEESGKSVE